MRRKWTTLVLVALVTVAVSVPTAVWASHQFNDVSDSNVFHEDIDWLARNRITLGCNPPDNTEFCPSESVIREQMAAFMKRLAESRAVDAGSVRGHGVRDLGAVFGTRDKDMAPSGTTTTQEADVATRLAFTAPTDGVALITGKAILTNESDVPTQANLVLTLDLDESTDGAPAVVDGNTHPLARAGRHDQNETASLSTAVPVSKGEHVVHLLINGPADAVSWNLENISVVFSPTGSASGPGVTPASGSNTGFELLP